MSSPLTLIARETFISNGVSKTINLPGNIEWIQVRDISNINTPANTQFVEASWTIGMNNGTAIVRSYTASAPATSVAVVATNGIGQVNTSDQNSLEAALISTAISSDSPAVVSLASTAGLANGDVVRLSNSTGMLQVAGMDFTISSVTTNTSVALSFLDSSAFAAAATAATIRKVNNPPLFSPRQFLITAISKAANARFTLSVTSDIAIGEELSFQVPSEFGMVEMNGLRGTVTAIGNADASGFTNTIDLDINSSSFSDFKFPSSTDFPINFAQAIRFGNVSQQVLAPTDNIGSFQITLGSAVVGSSGHTIEVLMMSGISI